MNLQQALSDVKWQEHNLGDTYVMDGKEGWKIAYYPIFESSKGEVYAEPRALVEKPFKGGIDLRKIPLRYLKKGA